MADLIQLLPDSVANQIAAGEVIQRPSSVVKELLENSIDAGSSRIKLVIKNAGKTLVQVTDDGCGMSGTDVRMAFERHATSKIQNANDLFSIKTKGFRGEALASIAAIAHLEVKTKLHDQDIGTRIEFEGGKVIDQEPFNCPAGTTIQVKNLFFNVPARRNFLKSNPVETKHIIEEFQRVGLTHPDVEMEMYNDQNQVFHLPKGTFKQRLINVFGKKYEQRLVPVEEETDLIRLSGFVCKPEYAKKTRGEQYFFVNDRFIKNYYLDHAVGSAFEQLIPQGEHPSYFLKIEVDPQRIDINIHPTKTELKFDDEKAVYAILQAAVKRSLGKYNITPTLDFEQEKEFDIPLQKEKEPVKPPELNIDPDYNPFEQEKEPETKGSARAPSQPSRTSHKGWEDLYRIRKEGMEEPFSAPREDEGGDDGATIIRSGQSEPGVEERGKMPPYQVHNRYILTHIRSGIMLIDQQKAHVRVLYEQYLETLKDQGGSSQQQLFPKEVELNPSDMELIREIEPDLRRIGFDISEFREEGIIVNGVPSSATEKDIKGVFEDLLEQYKHEVHELEAEHNERIALALARSTAIPPEQKLDTEEMRDLIDRLFGCELPFFTPTNKPTIVTFTLDELAKRFS